MAKKSKARLRVPVKSAATKTVATKTRPLARPGKRQRPRSLAAAPPKTPAETAAPTDREIADFSRLLFATAASAAQGLFIQNSNASSITVSYSADNKVTWKAVATDPTVPANSPKLFDMRSLLGAAKQGPIYIRYKIGNTTRVVGGAWYYESKVPPAVKASYVLSVTNGDTGPTYSQW